MTRRSEQLEREQARAVRSRAAGAEAFGAFAALSLAALAVLVWSCRGVPLGVPVADDYDFLYRLAFSRPLEWFDSMGTTVYWRPLSRQLYFSLLGPALPAAPWLGAAVHAVLLLALSWTLFLFGRRAFSLPVAIGIGLFPLLGEPTRVLLGWPSGAQYLLGALFVSLATLAALYRRWWPAAIAAGAAALSHELGVLALVMLPLVAWFGRRRKGEPLRPAVIATATVGAIFVAGYALALSRGAKLSGEAGGALHWEQIPSTLVNSLIAQLNLEGIAPGAASGLGVAYVLLFVVAIVLSLRRSVRERLRAAWPVILGALALALMATATTALAPAWNAWRTLLPALGLGVALMVWLGTVRSVLVWAFVAVRLAGLLVAPAALPVVTDTRPDTPSDFSLIKMARIQRTVESTRRALTEHYPSFPSDAEVRFTGLPHLTYFGYKGAHALRVWYRDSTLQWRAFGGVAGFAQADAMVTFDLQKPWPASIVGLNALGLLDRARREIRPGRLAVADSLLDEVIRSSAGSTTFQAIAYRAQAAVALDRSRVDRPEGSVAALDVAMLARADSLVRISIGLDARDADTFLIAALIAEQRSDPQRTAEALRRCLARSPNHKDCSEMAIRMGLLKPLP